MQTHSFVKKTMQPILAGHPTQASQPTAPPSPRAPAGGIRRGRGQQVAPPVAHQRGNGLLQHMQRLIHNRRLQAQQGAVLAHPALELALVSGVKRV